MVIDASLGRAPASCSRCYKRKKKCDRTLPLCRNCNSARVRCSFQDDQGETASYPVEYVRSLEERLRALECSATVGSRHARPIEAETSNVIFANNDLNSLFLDNNEPQEQPDGAPEDRIDLNPDIAPATVEPSMEGHNRSFSALSQAPTFAEELRALSLEATAERHLGSTSGLPFAKLTEKVLRRLTPDKADFVFINCQEDTTGASLFAFESPANLSGESVLQGLSESISSHPLLFGDLFLADFTESNTTALNELAWPSDETQVECLVDFYFAHSHTLYPILDEAEFRRTLGRVCAHPQLLAEQQPLEVFRLWMVLAIGSTAYSSISLTDEIESRIYYSKALQYLEPALGADDMSALEVIMLQVSYSFFNQLGPNTWFLVGTAARLALGMGLHTNWAYAALPTGVAERRKRIFFSIYMMDRVVSLALGRPFAIHDNDVDVDDFSVNDNSHYCASEGTASQNLGQPSKLAVPLHILALRRIASKISAQVYSVRKAAQVTDDEREEILSSLHGELLEWRRNMPFPLPDIQEGVPHLTTTWYDFNYYTHLAMIYRPSPLCPVSDVRRIRILESAASMSIRQAYSMHQQRRLAYNWLTFLTLFTSTISLVYAVTAQPEDLCTYLKQTRAIDDLDLALQLFETLGIKFVAATKIRNMIQEISKRYENIRAGQQGGIGVGVL